MVEFLGAARILWTLELFKDGTIKFFGDGVAAAAPMAAVRSRSLASMVNAEDGLLEWGGFQILETLQCNELKKTCGSLMMHRLKFSESCCSSCEDVAQSE
jgi:hypothetical protein